VPQCVVSWKYWFITGMNKYSETEQTIGRRSPENITLLDDLVLWFAHSGVKAQDDVFTRYPGAKKPDKQRIKKSLVRLGYMNSVRWAAVEAGLPKVLFSKTMWLYRATTKARGQSAKQVCKGRWAPHSMMLDKVFIYGNWNEG
jgi:hypothetical protein